MARIRARFSDNASGGMDFAADSVGVGPNSERTIRYDEELGSLVVVYDE